MTAYSREFAPVVFNTFLKAVMFILSEHNPKDYTPFEVKANVGGASYGVYCVRTQRKLGNVRPNLVLEDEFTAEPI